MPEVKFLNRGFKNNLVLIPGWASDYQIYNSLDLKYNYLLPVGFSCINFAAWLEKELGKLRLEKVSILGWSMGGFLAGDFAARYPEKINELLLLGIREKFAQGPLEGIALKLKENKRAWLYKFYPGCFSEEDSEGRAYFKKELLKNYIEEMRLEELIKGLRYLSEARLNTKALSKINKIRIFHGELDAVCPVGEARSVSQALPNAKFICFNKLGHILFLNKQFSSRFYG